MEENGGTPAETRMRADIGGERFEAEEGYEEPHPDYNCHPIPE